MRKTSYVLVAGYFNGGTRDLFDSNPAFLLYTPFTRKLRRSLSICQTGQTEICRNKRTPFRGTPLFPVPTGNNGILYLHKMPICILLSSCAIVAIGIIFYYLSMRSQIWKEGKKAFPLDTEIAGISNRKFWLNGNRPLNFSVSRLFLSVRVIENLKFLRHIRLLSKAILTTD